MVNKIIDDERIKEEYKNRTILIKNEKKVNILLITESPKTWDTYLYNPLNEGSFFINVMCGFNILPNCLNKEKSLSEMINKGFFVCDLFKYSEIYKFNDKGKIRKSKSEIVKKYNEEELKKRIIDEIMGLNPKIVILACGSEIKEELKSYLQKKLKNINIEVASKTLPLPFNGHEPKFVYGLQKILKENGY